jgi:hypothetical protein
VPTEVDLAPYSAIKNYHASLLSRPSIAKAFNEEMALYKAELVRNKRLERTLCCKNREAALGELL